jgi:hypothetical protein
VSNIYEIYMNSVGSNLREKNKMYVSYSETYIKCRANIVGLLRLLLLHDDQN